METAFRQFCTGISTRDVALMRAATDPDVEFTSYFAGIEAKTFRGHAGLADYVTDVSAAWESFQLTAKEFVPAGPARLVVCVRVEAVSRRGLALREDHYGVWEFRDGKARRGRTYLRREEALQAVEAHA
jgi:ketosteroid isomerase-like protein